MNTNQRITVKTKIALEAERLKRLEAGKRPSECTLTIIMEEMVLSQPALLTACRNFFEWHANHFEDFETETNGQLLELANNAEAAIALVK